MSVRILHLSEATPESPFLSSPAAAARWLSGALRERGSVATTEPLDLLDPRLCMQRAETLRDVEGAARRYETEAKR